MGTEVDAFHYSEKVRVYMSFTRQYRIIGYLGTQPSLISLPRYCNLEVLSVKDIRVYCTLARTVR